ncbi:MAG: YraN family protein [Elusimicrobia bacterium]|nr:YraN family protein [Elusimicrobiota bacterium]
MTCANVTVKPPESRKKENIKKDNLKKGAAAENSAEQLLRRNNYSIKARNWRSKIGEIDIIADNGGYLCFIEVKYRKDNSFGYPSQSVDSRKRRKLSKLARFYMLENGITDKDVRFDVVEVSREGINLIKNAFPDENTA